MYSSINRLGPLESGFESLKIRLYIRSPFFFLAILFVLFDLELVLLFPRIFVFSKVVFSSVIWTVTLILILVTLTLEWVWSGLKWQI
jgi:NADH:ubiquinone oxidoreductase subunit 3 (subunit A)